MCQTLIAALDFYKDGYSGSVDTLTGFSLVTSLQTCYVWQHAQVRLCHPRYTSNTKNKIGYQGNSYMLHIFLSMGP